MGKILLLADKRDALAEELLCRLKEVRSTHEYSLVDSSSDELLDGAPQHTCCIYLPPLLGRYGMVPNLPEARRGLQHIAHAKVPTAILVSSALIYGVNCGRQSLASEDYSAPGDQRRTVSSQWTSLERLAAELLEPCSRLTILRPVTILPSHSLLSVLLKHKIIPTLPGHDPTLQLLSVSDLAGALICAAEHHRGGVFNVAPDHVVPLHAAVRFTRRWRVPIPRTLQRLVRRSETLDYIRYPWTISNSKIKNELGFLPAKSSIDALLEQHPNTDRVAPSQTDFDPFGMDTNYIRFYGNTLFRFLCDYYWRIEVKGLEHLPREGAGILVGPHRGFMPFDGVMILHILAQRVGRFPRFLIHPGLLKFPFLANFMTKLGGIIASQESAAHVLQSGELLGLFPEGIKGAFSYYRDAYTLQAFGRNAFVKLAIQNRVPILPFLTVGSAEIFPILRKIKSQFWTRYTEWPCLPITPTFPVLPVPLPSKWHMQFLPPIHVERRYPPEAAHDKDVVKAVSFEVRAQMQQVWNEMVRRRRAVFWGSLF